MENISLLEFLYKKSTSVELSQSELDYLSTFDSLLSDMSTKKLSCNEAKHFNKNNIEKTITKLENGNYILDLHSKKINLNISGSKDGNYTYDIFISDIGNISITGNDKKKMTSELLYFLTNLKKDNPSFNKNDDLIGSISRVNVEGIISEGVFDKWRSIKADISTDINKSKMININGTNIDKYFLSHLGGKIEGKSIKNINLADTPNWENNLSFYPVKLNNFLLTASGSDEDNKVISIIKYIIKNKKKNIKKILSEGNSRVDYILAKENLAKVIELKKSEFDFNYWDKLRKAFLKPPRYMRIISNIGYANICFGVWRTINSTIHMVESLENGDLTVAERKEIKTNLALMWPEMAYNGVSELIEISIAKGILIHKSDVSGYLKQFSTRVGIALNILSVGFDIYNAYDNFSRISEESNEKRRIDYIVNGSMAVVSGLITLGISIAMLAGSAVAGPIGIVAGVMITLATSIYNAARLIEEAKAKVHFTPWEELRNGFNIAFAGDFIPDKKNEILLFETVKQLEEVIDKKALDYFDEIKK